MDMKQAAQQAIAAEQSAADEKKRAEARKLEQLKRGESDFDLIALALTAEQQALIDEFIAAVPAKCWTTDKRRKYRHSDGTIRMSNSLAKNVDSDEKKADSYLLKCNPKYKTSSRKREKLTAQLVAEFPTEGVQHSVCLLKRVDDYVSRSSASIYVFEDGICFALSVVRALDDIDREERDKIIIYQLKEWLIERLAELLKSA